jgi:hypothetical protein
MAAFIRSCLALRTLLKLRGCAGGLTARSFPTAQSRKKITISFRGGQSCNESVFCCLF